LQLTVQTSKPVPPPGSTSKPKARTKAPWAVKVEIRWLLESPT
jgi:hypothetical protein